MKGALEGIRVISLAWMLPGNYCTQLLGGMGAEVIMIEQPGIGEPARYDGFQHFLYACYHSKKSLTLNLKDDKGREIMHRLVKTADVVMEGFRPGKVKKLGIDYETLSEINPRLIYASLTGYGQYGPYRDMPGHDPNFQAVAGVLSDTGSADGDLAAQVKVPMADISTAMFTTIGILAALQARHTTGRGQYIDVAAADCLTAWNCVPLQSHLMGRDGDLMPAEEHEPGGGFFETSDGKFIILAIGFEDHMHKGLCEAIGRPDLGDLPRPERLARRDEIKDAFRKGLLTKTADEWVPILQEKSVPASMANTIAQATEDPHLIARGMFPEIETPLGKLKCVAPPVKFSDTPALIRHCPPDLGEHNESLLSEIGYKPDEIEGMRQNGVI